MDKIIELLLYTTFIFAILTRFKQIFYSEHIALFFSLFLYNLLFEVIVAVYDKLAIKIDLIFNSVNQSLTSIAIFVILYELLSKVPEMSELVRMTIIAIVIALVTKFYNKIYKIRI